MSEDVPFAPEPASKASHYYGDTVRVLFVIGAAILLVSQFTPDPFMAPIPALILAVVFVLAAGLTNPVQLWIQWVNMLLSGGGLVFFGSIALMRYQETGNLFGKNILLIILVLLFLVTFYVAVRTLRGVLMRDAPTIT
ncbi:MAG: hypothetical protein WBK28_00230 [Minisyncoccia bacterium]